MLLLGLKRVRKQTHGLLVEVEHGGAEELDPLPEYLLSPWAVVGRRCVVETWHLGKNSGGGVILVGRRCSRRSGEDPLKIPRR